MVRYAPDGGVSSFNIDNAGLLMGRRKLAAAAFLLFDLAVGLFVSTVDDVSS